MGAIQTFRLTRYFSVLSLVLIVIAGAALGLSARQQATFEPGIPEPVVAAFR